MTIVLHVWPYGKFTEIKGNLREKIFIKRIKTQIFLEVVLAIEIISIIQIISIIIPIHFSQPQHLKKMIFPKSRPIHFHMNSTRSYLARQTK